MTALELQECLDALPPDIRRELDEIREIGRGPFGRAQTQQIVDDHLVLLLRLRREYHATHADLVEVLGLYARANAASGKSPVPTADPAEVQNVRRVIKLDWLESLREVKAKKEARPPG